MTRYALIAPARTTPLTTALPAKIPTAAHVVPTLITLVILGTVTHLLSNTSPSITNS